VRIVYGVIGAAVGALVDLAINLLAAVIQARTPEEQFRQWPVAGLIGFIVVGLLIGLWLGKELVLQPQQPQERVTAGPGAPRPQPIKIRRLRAFLSYGRLRGQGIELKDILLVASVLDVDSRSS
jgi:uncharacterized membrane protein YeaQ/YmgE (transglycosylase-associated protein family)